MVAAKALSFGLLVVRRGGCDAGDLRREVNTAYLVVARLALAEQVRRGRLVALGFLVGLKLLNDPLRDTSTLRQLDLLASAQRRMILGSYSRVGPSLLRRRPSALPPPVFLAAPTYCAIVLRSLSAFFLLRSIS